MTDEERKAIELQAIRHNGQTAQIDITIEELSELTKELCKFKRGYNNCDHIAEECADVLICMEQLAIMLCIEDAQVERHMDAKLQRLAYKMQKRASKGSGITACEMG